MQVLSQLPIIRNSSISFKIPVHRHFINYVLININCRLLHLWKLIKSWSRLSIILINFVIDQSYTNTSKKRTTFSRFLRGLKTSHRKEKHGTSSPRHGRAATRGVPQRVSQFIFFLGVTRVGAKLLTSSIAVNYLQSQLNEYRLHSALWHFKFNKYLQKIPRNAGLFLTTYY